MDYSVAVEYVSAPDALTLASAEKLVPREFIPAWDWFQSMEGQTIPRLPNGQDAPSSVPIKLASQSGIHTPGIDSISGGWRNGRKYALTIYTSGKRYKDAPIVHRPDGTWLLDYQMQTTEEGRKRRWDHNEPLVHCLEDGIPVGVLVGQPSGGYIVYGLAFVERFNPETKMFTLHGPANVASDLDQRYCVMPAAELTDTELQQIEELRRLSTENTDERVKAFVQQVIRIRQTQFSKAVFEAYGYRCAISDTSVQKTLQAAHIDNYRGRRSQIVQNGILLRADLHLLYDANLLSIRPNDFAIELADAPGMQEYEQLIGKNPHIRLPKDEQYWPDEKLLEVHYSRFLLSCGAA